MKLDWIYAKKLVLDNKILLISPPGNDSF